jgi:hypothetical protein
MKARVIKVECRCSTVLFKYNKIGERKLIKCYLPRILRDYVNLPENIRIGTDVFCPDCNERIGTVFGIKGMRAIKLNQGKIKPFRLN